MANDSLLLNLTKFKYEENNTFLEIVGLDDGGLLEILIVYLDEEI
jgi:hypothetical protein